MRNAKSAYGRMQRGHFFRKTKKKVKKREGTGSPDIHVLSWGLSHYLSSRP